MSRRNDLLKQLLASDKFGEDKDKEQRFMQATAEMILTDFINIAINGFNIFGAGTIKNWSCYWHSIRQVLNKFSYFLIS